MMIQRQSFIFWSIVVFCAFSLVLSGCGKKPAAVTPEAAKTAETPAATIEGPAQVAEVPQPSTAPITEYRTLFGFEGDLSSWEIPAWTDGQADYVGKSVSLSSDFASEGTSSMKLEVDFPGDIWAAGLTEIQQYLDLSQYRVISADFYIPADAPQGLKAKIILTVGENWKFVEMNREVPLEPGKWVTITASIEPGSYDWKRVVPDEAFSQDVRKVALRVISNRVPKYTGPVYIDNVRVGK